MIKKKTVISQIDIIPADIDLKNPFITSLGKKTSTRNVFVVLKLSGGITGYGEASSSLAIPSATQDVMMRELIGLKQQAVGLELEDALEWTARGIPEDTHATSFSALEMALYDAKARLKGVPLLRLFGTKNETLETSLTVSALPADISKKFASRESKKGFRRFKIKVGINWDQDLKRVLAVHEAAPKAAIILDGNQGFSVPGVIEFVGELGRRNVPVEFLEQPLPKASSWEEWVLLRDSMKLPLALDESISNCQDANDFIRRKLVNIINIKIAKSGIGEALRIMRLAHSNGIKLMIGCMAESAVGLATSVHLAAGTGTFSAVDLDSSYLLKPSKNLAGGFISKGPFLKVPSRIKGSGTSVTLRSQRTKVTV